MRLPLKFCLRATPFSYCSDAAEIVTFDDPSPAAVNVTSNIFHNNDFRVFNGKSTLSIKWILEQIWAVNTHAGSVLKRSESHVGGQEHRLILGTAAAGQLGYLVSA
jgi:hypothetical protein